jgi:hypothetical protein
MPLPHYTQLPVLDDPAGPGTLPQEPVYKNLFEVSFILPIILQAQGRNVALLLQEATTVDLDLTPTIAVLEQRYKYSTRAFMGMPDKTTKDFSIDFQVNVNNKGAMDVWNTLKSWYDLVWNSQNGTLHYKSDIIGTVIVNQHDRKGYVLRRVTFQNVQIKGMDSLALSWEGSGDLWKIKADFVADFWIDEVIDGNYAINNPNVYG